jgi:S1-C subfamily serine protease
MDRGRESAVSWGRLGGLLTVSLLIAGTACGVLEPTPTATLERTPVATPTAADPILPTLTGEAESVRVLESQVIAVYELTSPAVVNVTCRFVEYDTFFRRSYSWEGTGSGFVYDSEGHIVTNYHVVEDAQEVWVALADGESYEGEVVGEDPSSDLAVLRVQASNLPQPIGLADSDELSVGQFVVAIGNPFGLERTLTYGVISSLGRVIESPDGRYIGEAIQTDAAINQGNSGGPLLDLEGRVIGVNSQIISPSGGNVGVGFAVPANTVRRVVPALIEMGSYPHPWMGVEPYTLTPADAAILRDAGMTVTVDEGVLALEVVDSSPADVAGIRGPQRTVRAGRYSVPVGMDIIVALDGVRVRDAQELFVYLDVETSVGDTIEVTVVREGQEITLPVTLGSQP